MFSPSSRIMAFHFPQALVVFACLPSLLASLASSQQPEVIQGEARPLPAPTIREVPVPAPLENSTTEYSSSEIEPAVVTASATEPLARSLQSILIQAKNGLDVNALPNPTVSKSELEYALNDLENFIGMGTQNGQAWNAFLRLDELRAELAKETPATSTLVDLEMNLRQNYLGLEYQQFTQLREKLNRYTRAVRYGASPEKSIKILAAKIDELVGDLNSPVEGTGLQRSGKVGIVANYLFESGQVPWAVSQLRGEFSTPNIQVYARESLLNRLLMRPIAQPSPVDECILGTRILGRACLQGSVSADVVPMSGGVSLRLNMFAAMTSQNKGYNRGVVLNTIGSSPVFASKQIFVTPDGVSSTPAIASTNLQSSIQSIEHRLRIVRRIAKKKAAEQKPQADAIAQGRLQNKVQTQYDEQVNTQLAQASGQLTSLRQTPRPELNRTGFPKPSFAVYSTDSTVNGNLVQAANYQLAASSNCPIAKPLSSDVVLEGHQSAVINALDVLLGGRTIRSENLDEYAQQILGEVPEEILKEANDEAWSITFAPFHPIEIEFVDGQVHLTLRILKMTRGEQTLDDSANISVTYNPSFSDGVLTLLRDADVEIGFVKNAGGFRATALRSFLKLKMETTFKEEIVTKRIDLAKHMPNAPALVVNSLKIDQGWVQVGLR
jgi:hypothetical protein